MALDSTQLTTFQAVIDEGSFEAAARLLHVTPSAISQRIKALEHAVGQVLVKRTKPCQATEPGQALFRLAGQLELLEREAVDAVRGPLAGDRQRTRVTVVVNADSMATWFIDALTRLPGELAMTFDLLEEDQDHTIEPLREGAAMAAVTAQRRPVQGCRVARLGAMRYLAVAAPHLHQREFADGPNATNLATTPMLVFNRKDQLQHRFLERLSHRRLEPPIHYIPSVLGLLDAIRGGLGWGMVPERLVRAELDAGRCVELAPERYLDVPLYWQCWRMESATLTALTASVTAAAADALH